MDFDMCEEEPLKSDWVGIYPCDVETMIATQEWWNTVLANPGYIGMKNATMEDYGYVEGTEYPKDQQLWWSYTCGSPTDDGPCQQDDSAVWPSEGSVTVDPNDAPSWAMWRGSSSGLTPGCYKVLLNRDLPRESVSPPPIPTVCPGQAWQDAYQFQIP